MHTQQNVGLDLSSSSRISAPADKQTFHSRHEKRFLAESIISNRLFSRSRLNFHKYARFGFLHLSAEYYRYFSVDSASRSHSEPFQTRIFHTNASSP